jgi:hypothetical protein
MQEDPPKDAWQSMDDAQLRQHTDNVAANYCQSSEWEGIPLDNKQMQERIFAHYKSLRDGN